MSKCLPSCFSRKAKGKRDANDVDYIDLSAGAARSSALNGKGGNADGVHMGDFVALDCPLRPVTPMSKFSAHAPVYVDDATSFVARGNKSRLHASVKEPIAIPVSCGWPFDDDSSPQTVPKCFASLGSNSDEASTRRANLNEPSVFGSAEGNSLEPMVLTECLYRREVKRAQEPLSSDGHALESNGTGQNGAQSANMWASNVCEYDLVSNEDTSRVSDLDSPLTRSPSISMLQDDSPSDCHFGDNAGFFNFDYAFGSVRRESVEAKLWNMLVVTFGKACSRDLQGVSSGRIESWRRDSTHLPMLNKMNAKDVVEIVSNVVNSDKL